MVQAGRQSPRQVDAGVLRLRKSLCREESRYQAWSRTAGTCVAAMVRAVTQSIVRAVSRPWFSLGLLRPHNPAALNTMRCPHPHKECPSLPGSACSGLLFSEPRGASKRRSTSAASGQQRLLAPQVTELCARAQVPKLQDLHSG